MYCVYGRAVEDNQRVYGRESSIFHRVGDDRITDPEWRVRDGHLRDQNQSHNAVRARTLHMLLLYLHRHISGQAPALPPSSHFRPFRRRLRRHAAMQPSLARGSSSSRRLHTAASTCPRMVARPVKLRYSQRDSVFKCLYVVGFFFLSKKEREHLSF